MSPQPYTQAERLLRISVEGQSPDTLLLERFAGVERLSVPFEYGVDLLSERAIKPEDLIGKHLTIEIDTPGDPVWIDGLIRRFAVRAKPGPLDVTRSRSVTRLA